VTRKCHARFVGGLSEKESQDHLAGFLPNGVLADGSDEAARDWVKRQADANYNVGALPEAYMRDIDIVRYDRAGHETRRWRLHGAWVKSLEYDELEGGSSDNTIEKITLTYQWWD